MAIFNGKGPTVRGPKADLRPLLVRLGGPDQDEFVCPTYPRWVKALNGESVLVENGEEEAEIFAADKSSPITGTLKLKG